MRTTWLCAENGLQLRGRGWMQRAQGGGSCSHSGDGVAVREVVGV